LFQSAHDTYLESRVLSADPLELVRLLYQGAIAAVKDARHYLAQGKILERSRAISKACGILIELTTGLDHARGGEIAGRLASLYDYLQKRLLEANFQQSDGPLAEVLGLLMTLAEGWANIHTPAEAPEASNAWSQPPLVQQTEVHAASRSWSL